jgi:hypothetical protein
MILSDQRLEEAEITEGCARAVDTLIGGYEAKMWRAGNSSASNGTSSVLL